MSEKQSKAARKEARLFWRRYISHFSNVPFWERVKIAFAIIFLKQMKGK